VPFPNEHSARLKSPTLFSGCRRNNDRFGTGIHAIFCKRKSSGKWELQAIRFSKKRYSSKKARQWLKEHDYKKFTFEAASTTASTQEMAESVARKRVRRQALEGVAKLQEATWTTAYVNSLPDSAFLYVEPGGKKDSNGRTVPRSKRHFPYKNAQGGVDMPHLRNAKARLGQPATGRGWLTDGLRKRLIAKANRVVVEAKKK